MRDFIQSCLVLPEAKVPEQLKKDTMNAFNLLQHDGKIHEDCEYDFRYGQGGKLMVRIWRPDPNNMAEALGGVIWTDPKELIVAAGSLSRVRGKTD